MEEDIEVLEIDEVKEIGAVLHQASHSRDTMLKMANQALEKQSGNMMTYAKLTKKMKQLKEAYLLLKVEKESLEKEIIHLREMQQKMENELIALRFENEQNKKKRSALQSLLQVLLNVYGVHEVIKILGIPYMKLKEYLEE